MTIDDNNPLDALRTEWGAFGKRLDQAEADCPQVELNFGRVRRLLVYLTAVLVVAWFVAMAAIERWVPESKGHCMAGRMANRPAEAVECIETMLHAV